MYKATGIVTSVPSDSPDDYATLKDMRESKKLINKYNIDPYWTKADPIPIIQIPGFDTNMAAIELYNKKKIKTHYAEQDRKKLAEAKDEVYKLGFHKGIMIYGEFNGLTVEEAKIKVKDKLIESNYAHIYYEPEKKVVGRSGDECIVA